MTKAHSPQASESQNGSALLATKFYEGGEQVSGLTTSVVSGTATAMPNTTEFEDLFGMHSGSNPTRYVATVPGIYLASAFLSLAAETAGYNRIWFQKNGVATQLAPQDTGFNGGSNYVSTLLLIRLAANDYLEAYVRQVNGSNIVTSLMHMDLAWLGF